MTVAFAGRIVNPRSDGVLYGPGVAQAELPALLDRVGASRVFLVTTPSLERSGMAADVAGWGEVEVLALGKGGLRLRWSGRVRIEKPDSARRREEWVRSRANASGPYLSTGFQ